MLTGGVSALISIWLNNANIKEADKSQAKGVMFTCKNKILDCITLRPGHHIVSLYMKYTLFGLFSVMTLHSDP